MEGSRSTPCGNCYVYVDVNNQRKVKSIQKGTEYCPVILTLTLLAADRCPGADNKPEQTERGP